MTTEGLDECQGSLLIINKPTLVQVMAWCRQATGHYLNQRWPRSVLPYGATRPQCVNTMRPRQNGRHFVDYISNQFLYMTSDLIWTDLNFIDCVPKYSRNDIVAVVQIMTWRRTGDNSLTGSTMDTSLFENRLYLDAIGNKPITVIIDIIIVSHHSQHFNKKHQ